MHTVVSTDSNSSTLTQEDLLVQDQTTKFTIWGSEAKQKQVARSGKSGRIYLPVSWIGKTVMVVKVD